MTSHRRSTPAEWVETHPESVSRGPLHILPLLSIKDEQRPSAEACAVCNPNIPVETDAMRHDPASPPEVIL